MTASWKTTTAGIAGLVALVATAVKAYTDNDPATNPDWSALIAAGTALVGLLFARDNSVTSEQAGLK